MYVLSNALAYAIQGFKTNHSRSASRSVKHPDINFGPLPPSARAHQVPEREQGQVRERRALVRAVQDHAGHLAEAKGA